MKILFLDIDGVLNSKRTRVAFGRFPLDLSPLDISLFDRVALNLIRVLCLETGASIVLSSDWRLDHSAPEVSRALDLPVIGATPKLSRLRGFEINAWLSNNPGVTTFAIVDDIPQMLDSQSANFVQTDDEFGLTLRNYLDLKRILSWEKK